MTNMKLPICSFPTKTIIIDDNREFLDSLTLNLSYKNHSYELFCNIYEALDYIEQNKRRSLWFQEFVNYLEGESAEKKLIEINLQNLYKQIFGQNRFSVITSIVVDYDMPDLNGLELCHKLKDLSANKILLTGAADEKLAVDAFNASLIDCFIAKHDTGIYQTLNLAIQKASETYFEKISMLLAPLYEGNNFMTKNYEFSSFFINFINRNKISEYYLLETDNYSYLVVDSKNRVGILSFFSEKDLESVYLLAKLEELPTSVLSELVNKSKVFSNYKIDEGQVLMEMNWDNPLKDLKEILIGNQKYYYFYDQDVQLQSNIKFFNL